MKENKTSSSPSLEAKEEVLNRLIEKIYRQEAEATHDEITIALNKLVETKSRELEGQSRELAEVYAALNVAHHELLQAQKLEAMGRLAAGVAHEINTPTQYVGDSIQFIREGIDDLLNLLAEVEPLIQNASQPSAVQFDALKKRFDLEYLSEHLPKAVDRASEGLGRVVEIVKSMKTFSYPDQKVMSDTDLIAALRTTLAISKNEYKYFAKIETEFEDLPPVCCLAGEINQVFLNLIINAAHAIEEVNSCTGELGLITIRARRDGEMVVVEIQDTGTGIPEAVQPKIFDPFFTTKEMGKGTGQGLAIARQVITEKHGGDLSFVTEVGKGTTFTIRLPITQSF